MTTVDQPAGEQVERSDAELIAAVRAGDQAAYGELFSRHELAARRLARQIARPADADELVSEAFYRVLRAINGGGGPDGAFRPYLLSTLRRANIDTGRSYHQRVNLTDDDTHLEAEPAASAADVALAHDEDSAAWRAWASLPEASRTLLWHLIVEEESPAAIAPLLGTTPNGVSSRAVRAKERLRQAFLTQHIRTAASEQCEWTRQRLGEYVRKALSKRSEAAVERHLKECERCKAAAAYLTDVNLAMRAAVVPVVLGGAAIGAKYLAAGGAAHAAPLLWLGKLRPRGTAATATAAAGVAAAVAAAAFAAIVLTGNDGPNGPDSTPAAAGTHAALAPPPPSTAAPAPAPVTSATPSDSATPSTTAPPSTASSSRPPPPPRPSTSTPPRTHTTRPAPPPPPPTASPTRTPTPTSSPPPTSPSPSPTPTTSPAGPESSVPLTVTRTRWFWARVSDGWTIVGVDAPGNTPCQLATDQWVVCWPDASTHRPYHYTVTVAPEPGTTSGTLSTNADERSVPLSA